TALAAAAPTAKQRNLSVAGVYRQGPLAVGVGYANNDKTFAAGTDADSWHINASYQLGSVKLGGAYVEIDANPTAATTYKINNWHLGAEWKLAGPHNVHFGYTQVGDGKGTAGAVLNALRPAARADTGAKLWQVKYVHDLSKRTFTSVGYTHLKNDRFGTYNLNGFGVANAGSKNKGFVANIGHRF
ncbi:MAG: porin, partial [Burkholderiales bacterium]|nr:porin [Burkholderiales bacterium]